MKHLLKMLVFLFMVIVSLVMAQPTDVFLNLFLETEENPVKQYLGKQLALQKGLPNSIHLPDGTYIYVIGTQDQQPLYAVLVNAINPAEGARLMFFEEIKSRYNLNEARIYWGDGKWTNAGNRYQTPSSHSLEAITDTVIMVIDSQSDRVILLDPFSGDLIDTTFITTQGTLGTPIQAQQSPQGTITISDQIQDLVQEYDTSSAYLGPYAPAGGVNNAILNNAREHQFHNGSLLVCNADPTNDDAIAEFDTAGNYLGNFIANGAGGLDSPWGILFRANDVLVSASVSDAIHRYDHSGNYLSDFVTGLNFPRQMIELPSGDVAVAGFSGIGQSGTIIYDASGNYITILDAVMGIRGVWRLGNGNLLVTNSVGIYEVDPVNNLLVRPIMTGISGQHFSIFIPQSQPLVAPKILISEFVVTPTAGEFIEVFNPNEEVVDLSNYYLTDATFAAGGQFYYNIVTDTLYGGGAFGDFHARFPAGATIQPGEYQTIAMNGTDFITTYGIQPTYELWDTDITLTDMREAKPGSINNQGGLTNGDEVIILYYWDGLSDLVADVDYVLYNSNSPVPNDEAVDKTGVRIDGPDADNDSSEYLPDTSVPSQVSAINHSSTDVSVHRIDISEGTQILSGGNGVGGSDETSENLDQTFSDNSLPSPNSGWLPASTARIQLVHNAADPAAAVMDVYLNGLILVDDLAFREATPFIDAPAGVMLNLGIAPGNSTSVADTIRNLPVDFEADSTYIGFACGVINPAAFAPNPDGEDISFTIHGQDRAREVSSTPGGVEVFMMHGITDASAVDVTVRGSGILFNDVIYSETTEYEAVPPDLYILDVSDSTGTQLFASFEADLSGLTDSALAIFASGFSEPEYNQNGPEAGLFILLANGTVIELPPVANYMRAQLIHNSPDPALEIVDVYFNDSLLIDDFTFRHATPFLDLPANIPFLLGFAPANSSSANDTIIAFYGEFEPNITTTGLVCGVLDSSAFAPNPDGLDISLNIWGADSSREISYTPGSVEFFALHGSPDYPAVDVVARGIGTLFEDVFYSDATEYITVSPISYTIDLYDSTGSTLLAAFTADLSTLADSALTVFASGFRDTVANQNGPAFGLFAALANGTVIELPSIPVGIIPSEQLVPAEYALHPNYPNPFNPTTTIKYDLKQAGDVRLTIYNLLGQKVHTLVNARQEAGYQSAIWDGRNDVGSGVASGIYIYRLEAGNYISTRKMILMK